MENLNNDVLENILFRLPFGVASSQAKRVCKLWKSILHSKRHNEVGFLFVGHHYDENKLQLYFGEEYDHIDGNKMNYYYTRETLMEMEHCRFANKSNPSDILVGSCNGLVCLKKTDSCTDADEPFAICNPLTGEFIFLKNSGRVWEFDALLSSGFGYCQSTDEYKVVRINSDTWKRPRVQVYTIGSNEWRAPKTPIDDCRFWVPGPGVFANSVLHWVVDVGRRAVAFDLKDEKFRELPVPPPELIEHEHNELKLLGRNLCWIKWNFNMTHTYIWVYKKKNINISTRYAMEEHDQKLDYYSENSWGWVKEFNIKYGPSYEPFAITKSNEVVLLGLGDLYCYDPKTQIIDKLGHYYGMGCSYIEAIPHANSYVSLKEFGETWYGPGCSPAVQTNSDVKMEVKYAQKKHGFLTLTKSLILIALFCFLGLYHRFV